ncbi:MULTISPECIES: fibronectin type III domain-containing protein [Halorussus]|uniref:fibronectin type III domain-containing protein n=1 Tax=Halorussus TaxID=1070314 RepID=UPI0020A062EF|nr:fibronectin type III domain-containing protein [Halorussus vallis]USZ78215.1 fibronectin type III domain-containing protein [Halorussus vallis]
MARDEKARDPVARRTYLKLAGIGMFSTTSVTAGGGTAAAAQTVGYGGGGYGLVAYGGSKLVDANPAVTVDGATNVTQTAATLGGVVSDLGGATSVTVRFEYRPVGATDWTATPEQSLSATGTFGRRLTGLAAGSDYEYRATATASDGDAAASSTVTFATKRHTLVIDGGASPGTLNDYSFAVSGDVEKSAELGSIQANDTVSGSTVSGEVLAGKDGYRFTGDVTDFRVAGSPAVYLDGERVDPADLGETTYPRTLVVDGARAPRERATYEATVSGKIKKSSSLGSVQANDTIAGATASGQVYGGKDGYRFTGGLTELRVDGALTVSLGGGDGDSASAGSLPNSFVVDGTGTPNRKATYSVTVTGSVEKSGELGSLQRNDVVSGSTASGEVVGGKDGYRYSGDVTRIEVTGPAVIRFTDTDG